MSLTKQGKYRSTDFEDSKHTLFFHAEKPAIRASSETEEPLEDHEHENESTDHPVIAGIAKSIQNPWQKYATAAFVGIVAVGVWFAWREMHRSHAESLRIIVGDFENSTGNLDFDQTLRTALTIDLRQSPYLEVATRDQLSKAILEEKAATDSSDGEQTSSPALTGSLVRRVCHRLNDQAYLTGEIHRFAQKYLITVQAFDCMRGSSLAASRGIADSPDGILTVLDKVIFDLREQLGESATSIARFNKPLFTKGTGSLEALRAYSDASRLALNNLNNQLEDSLTVYRRAIELDPKFAIAYADLGSVYNNLGQKDPASANLTKAYELRDTANELNRLSITSTYNGLVTRDIQASIRNDKEWAEEYPRDPAPFANLADLETQIGKPALALDPAKRALALNSDDGLSYIVLARAQMHTGQFEEAAHTCNQSISHHVDSAEIHGVLMQIAFLHLDQAAIDEQIAWARSQANDKSAESYIQSQQGLMDFALGKTKAAEAVFATVIDSYRKQGMNERADRITGEIARTEAELGNLETARSTLTDLREEASSLDIPVVWAETGEISRAQAMLQRELDAHPSDTLGREYQSPQVKAAIALNQHQPEVAITALVPALPYDLRLFGAPSLRGKAYLAANRPVEAEAEFHKILDHPGIEPLSYNYPLAQLGVARALARQDKTVEAGLVYKIVLQIWKDADPDLPRLREAKAEYARLNGESPKPVIKPAVKPSAKPAPKPRQQIGKLHRPHP
jgi:tetratricopeptide (TPR) repeat protein